MTAAAQPVAPLTTVQAPQGAHFEQFDTKTARGKEPGRQRPLLVWTDMVALAAFYGPAASAKIASGEISLKRNFLIIARDTTLSDDEVAEAQVAWRPEMRKTASQGTKKAPRLNRKALSDKVNAAGEAVGNLQVVIDLLDAIATKKISPDDVTELTKLVPAAAS